MPSSSARLLLAHTTMESTFTSPSKASRPGVNVNVKGVNVNVKGVNVNVSGPVVGQRPWTSDGSGGVGVGVVVGVGVGVDGDGDGDVKRCR